MAVHLRLARHGSIHRPFFHIVAADHRARRDGKFIEKLGTYNPRVNPTQIQINEERVRYWYSTGAQVSNVVASLLKAQNIKLERKKTATKSK